MSCVSNRVGFIGKHAKEALASLKQAGGLWLGLGPVPLTCPTAPKTLPPVSRSPWLSPSATWLCPQPNRLREGSTFPSMLWAVEAWEPRNPRCLASHIQ